MIYGIGVDMVEIERMKDSHMKDYVIARLFHPLEIAGIPLQEQRKKEYLASRFAAKEAFVKALHVGFREITPKDIGIQNDDLGKPSFVYTDKVAMLLPPNFSRVHVTISHEKNNAIAFVVIEVSGE